MRKWWIILTIITGTFLLVSFTRQESELTTSQLRKLYSQSPEKWPVPTVDAAVPWKELGILPGSPLEKYKDSLKHIIELGKILFFDTRLSGSGKISCASCHQPELSWTDGKEKSIGHEGTLSKRNSPTIQNSWFYNRLFWDGRAKDLEDQAFAPINSESEMHSDMRELPFRLRQVKGYAPLFKAAFGDSHIEPDRIAHAIAVFEKTIVSRKSRFDQFLEGDKNALSNKELRGLHVFRTKARCMNCHFGSMFTDNLFHKTGLTQNDEGLYNVTHKEEDRKKFKTPSLRDLMQTGPWLHDGSFNDIVMLLEIYGKGPRGADTLIRPFALKAKEMEALVSFLKAISAPPVEFTKPVLPE